MYLGAVLCVPVPGCLMLTLEVLRLGSIVVQVLHLLAVALSHYLGSLWPFQYYITATPAALRLTLAIVWVLPSECSYFLMQEFVSSVLTHISSSDNLFSPLHDKHFQRREFSEFSYFLTRVTQYLYLSIHL